MCRAQRTLSELTMETILRLVGRHRPLTATRHLQKLMGTSSQEVASEYLTDLSGFFSEDTRHTDENTVTGIGFVIKLDIWPE